MPKEWSVRIEAKHSEHDYSRFLNTLMTQLKQYSAVGSASPVSLELQLSFTADSMESAFAKSLKAFQNVIQKTTSKAQVVDVEIETEEHFDARLEAPDPEVVGIAELSTILGVSRARTSTIAARRDFPEPYARLASGPVWFKQNLSRWLDEWQHRPRVRKDHHTAALGGEPMHALAAKGTE